ncbi:Cytochrome P450 83B1 [Bienertia sinuspersici]
MILLLLFLIAIPFFIFLLQKHIKKYDPSYNPPPRPKGLRLIGNLHQYDPSKPHIYFAKLANIHGPIFSLQFGSVQVVVVHSAKLAKEVLQTQDLNFCYRPLTLCARKLSYNGLDVVFAQSLDYFREINKVCVVHLFSSKKIESLAQIRQEEVLRMINRISTLSFSSEIINLSEVLMSFSNSNICRTAFGKRYDDDEGSKRNRFHTLLNDAQALFATFSFADYFPSMGWLDKLTGLSAKLEKTFNDLEAFYEEVINDHLDPNRPRSEHEDLIDVMLNLRENRSLTFDLTMDHIKAVLMNIFIAGTDATTATLVWAMTELVKNPTCMRKVQHELRNSTLNNEGYVSMEDLPKLEYLKLVVKETLRYHPASPLLVVREALEKCSIEGYDILPKTLMFVNAWAIARDSEYWPNPDIFMPERFMGNSIDYKGKDFEYIPFGAGRKICPGMQLGVATVEVALANLLYSFDWELPDGMKIEDIDTDTLPGVTMHKKNPLCLVAKKYA